MFCFHFQSDDEDLEPTRDLTTKGLTSNIEENSEERSEVYIRIYISKDNFWFVDMFVIHFQCDDEDLEPTSNIEKNSEERSEVNLRIHIWKDYFWFVDMVGIHFQCNDEDLEPTRDLMTKGSTSNVEEKSEERSYTMDDDFSDYCFEHEGHPSFKKIKVETEVQSK